MAWNGLGITALYLGVASAARDWLTGFLTERTPTALGRPLATLPRFISAVGEIEASLTAAVDLVNGLAARADAGDLLPASHAGIAKLAAHQGRDRRGGASRRTGRQQRPDQEDTRWSGTTGTSFAPGCTPRRTTPS